MLERLKAFWLVRALGAGAIASVMDHGLGLTLAFFGAPTRVAAMSGKVVGAIFSYFAHRTFTFKDHAQSVAASGTRYVAFVVLTTVAHGQVVVWLRDTLGVPYLFAAVLADVLVVTPTWMLALRYFIFPPAPGASKSEPPPIVPPPPGT